MSLPAALRTLTIAATFACLASCASAPRVFAPGERCVTRAFSVVDGFPGARRGRCAVLADDHVRVDIRPEDDGRINNSAWYAFRVVPAVPGVVATVSLRYHGGRHRYPPKISSDGLAWKLLPERFVSSSPDRHYAEVRIPLSGDAIWVSAQELVTPDVYAAWTGKIAAAAGVSLRTLGTSTEGRPIPVLDSASAAKDILLLVGRQHPPEVSGAFAFLAFAATVFGDTDLARSFRARFRVLAIPLLNPDGVAAGNWRHNPGGVDLNRDWGLFTQPETRLVAGLLDEVDGSGSRLRMFIDFHSTHRGNVFYTQKGVTSPPGFTTRWLDTARSRIADYPFRNIRNHATNATLAENYIYTRYGIPAVTYEVDDETDRATLRDAARVFAQELMRLMLDQDY